MRNITDLCRGNIDFKKGYPPRSNIVKDKKDCLVADSYSIVARLRNCFSQLVNVRGFNDVRQTEIHAAEPLVPDPVVVVLVVMIMMMIITTTNCNWVVNCCQRLFYMYTNMKLVCY
jgi:hypothetical protein